MAQAHVLKFDQAGDGNNAILVQVTPKDATSLDLDLLATDGDAAYRGKGEQSSGQDILTCS
jgi:hypothetical protein